MRGKAELSEGIHVVCVRDALLRAREQCTVDRTGQPLLRPTLCLSDTLEPGISHEMNLSNQTCDEWDVGRPMLSTGLSLQERDGMRSGVTRL